MSATPRLSIGLPVYNGAATVAESIESLLGQTYDEFELVISDNASTDGTAEICGRYETQDARVRYFRQPRNVGAAANHQFVVERSRGELFKWVSHDDLYARVLLERCVDALDERPDAVLAHCWTAMIGRCGTPTVAFEYPLATDSPNPVERFRSMLFGSGGDDFYAVMRRSVLRQLLPQGTYYRSDRTLAAGLSLWGPFTHVPEWLYFRREKWWGSRWWPEKDWPDGRQFCSALDPRRSNRWLHPMSRLYAEYIWGYVTAIRRAPLTDAERIACYRILAEWVATRIHLRHPPQVDSSARGVPVSMSVDAAIAGRRRDG